MLPLLSSFPMNDSQFSVGLQLNDHVKLQLYAQKWLWRLVNMGPFRQPPAISGRQSCSHSFPLPALRRNEVANWPKHCHATAQLVMLLRPPYAPYLSCCLISLLPLIQHHCCFQWIWDKKSEGELQTIVKKNCFHLHQQQFTHWYWREKKQKADFPFATAPTIRNENNEAQNKDVELPKKTALCADRLEPDKLRWSVSEKLCLAVEANLCFYFGAAHLRVKDKSVDWVFRKTKKKTIHQWALWCLKNPLTLATTLTRHEHFSCRRAVSRTCWEVVIETVSKGKADRKLLTPTQTILFFHIFFFQNKRRRKESNPTRVHSPNPEQPLCSQNTSLTLNLSWWKTAHCHTDNRWQSCHMECVWRFSSTRGYGLGLARIAPWHLQGQAGKAIMQNQAVVLQSPGSCGSSSPHKKGLAVEMTRW